LAATSPRNQARYCGIQIGMPNCENRALAAGRLSRAILDFAPGMVARKGMYRVDERFVATSDSPDRTYSITL